MLFPIMSFAISENLRWGNSSPGAALQNQEKAKREAMGLRLIGFVANKNESDFEEVLFQKVASQLIVSIPNKRGCYLEND